MQKKMWLLALIIILIACYFIFDLQQYLAGDFLFKGYHQHPALTLTLYFIASIIVTALSLPVATLMTLAAGYLFGFWTGVVLISFASTIGATLACMVARTLLRDWVTTRFATQAERFNQGVKKDGAFFLFSLRLIPVVPFFVINLAMGLTAIRLRTFYWVSQVGMLAGTAVYVNAGTQLSQIEHFNVKGILTPNLIGAFVLLALFPWLVRTVMSKIQARKVYKPWVKPKRFDYNLVVIGAGAAGLVSAYIASAVKAKVLLIEKDKMGGDCLNTGCVPSKALLRSAKVAVYLKRAGEFGLMGVQARVDFKRIMERVQTIIKQVEPHDSVKRYTVLGVNCAQGTAEITSPWQVRINEETVTAKTIVIATGGRPYVPPLLGLDKVSWTTSDTIWSLREQPDHLLVLGGGPIGCELAQAFHRLGSKVTIVNRSPCLLPKEDGDAAKAVIKQFEKEGIILYLGEKVVGFDADKHLQWANIEDSNGKVKALAFDVALIALGRQANTEQLGLDTLGIDTSPTGTIKVNEWLQTRFPNIYACGDVAGPYQFTHTASHQAWYAAVNALFGAIKRFKADYRVIPWCTFTDPEVAHVGLNETQAKEQGVAYEVTRFAISELDRAIADSETQGFVKVLTAPNKDNILGATVVGYHAGELLAELTLAMRHGLGLNKLLSTIHVYPTLSEANKYVAGEWKKAHAPKRLLRWLEKWHRWLRKG